MFPDHPRVCVRSCIAGRQLLPLSAFSALMHSGALWVCWKWFPDPRYKMTWRFCSCKLLADCKHTEWNSNAIPEQPIALFSVTSSVLSLSYVFSSWLDFLTWTGVRCIKIAFPGYWVVVDFSDIPTVLSPSFRSCVVCESIKMGLDEAVWHNFLLEWYKTLNKGTWIAGSACLELLAQMNSSTQTLGEVLFLCW